MARRFSRNIFRTVVVTPLPTKSRPLIYRASYKRYSAYGRTAKEAVDKVGRKYHNGKFSVRNILNSIGISLLPPY